MKFCSQCGAAVEERVPEGDERERFVCTACEFIHYINPRVVVGVLPIWEEKILLCRRAIEPRSGYWTLPAGFLEMGESTEDGACRETLEEAGVQVELTGLIAIYNLTHINQVQLFYTGRLPSPELKPGHETLEAGLFAWDEIPWKELAFPTVHWVLGYYQEVSALASYPPHTNPEPPRLPE